VKYFVTGGSGFIGAHLVRRIQAEGHEVRGLARSGESARKFESMGAVVVRGDVMDREALQAGMQGCDVVFHLANLYAMWEAAPTRFERVNVDGTRVVFSAALAAGVGRVVYVSTAAVYGRPAQAPFVEDSPPGPVLFSRYARSKAQGEREAWQFAARTGLPLTVLYPGIVLGAGDDKASGQYIRDILFRRVPSTIYHQSQATYVAVCDVVEALLRAAALPQALGQKYLVGGTVMSGQAFVELVREVSGAPLPALHFPDWMVTAASYLFTGLANLLRRPPLWGLSVDAAHTLRNGFVFDGSKAERELGIVYTPVRKAVEDAVASYGNDST
jgi:dihydroflavonol-4-reductase